MTTPRPGTWTAPDPIAAVEAAERQALADHLSGACRESEWSCSHCEETECA